VTSWEVAAFVLVVGAVLPAILATFTGEESRRLIGLELAGTVVTAVMMLLAQADGRPDYLVAPLVLVALSLAGVLVFTRLLSPPPSG
jgi:multicomponent Na+:H+ antiporter subunit F